MRAEEHGAFRCGVARDRGHHVVDRGQLLVHVDGERHGRWTGPHAVRRLQSAAEARRRRGAAERRQQMLCFAPAHDHDGNLRQRGRGGFVDARGVRGGANPRRQRIAMPEPGVLRVAALQHLLAAPVAVWPRRPLRLAVVARITVEDERARAGLLGGVRLHGAVAAPVARQGNPALERHAERGELRVVCRQAVVHVDDLASGRARR